MRSTNATAPRKKSVYTCEMPWGDAGVAVQFTAVLDKPQRQKAVLDAGPHF
jgi:hypothetical protein